MSKSVEQFIYVLKLIPRLLNDDNWTKAEEEIVGRHFRALQSLQKDGRLILAGRTLNSDPDSFGIVILQVETEDEARMLMENDPAVREGIMTAKLYPYSVALISQENVKDRY